MERTCSSRLVETVKIKGQLVHTKQWFRFNGTHQGRHTHESLSPEQEETEERTEKRAESGGW